MTEMAADLGALAEAVSFLSYFNDLEDPRQRGKVMYPLDGMLLLSLTAVLAGAEGFTDIALSGRKKLAFLRRFRPFAAGTPSHDQIGALFASLDPGHFQHCFVAWVAALTGAPVEAIAIDGKTRRRTYQKKGAQDPDHDGDPRCRLVTKASCLARSERRRDHRQPSRVQREDRA